MYPIENESPCITIRSLEKKEERPLCAYNGILTIYILLIYLAKVSFRSNDRINRCIELAISKYFIPVQLTFNLNLTVLFIVSQLSI